MKTILRVLIILLLANCKDNQSDKSINDNSTGSCKITSFDSLEEAFENRWCVKELYLRDRSLKGIPNEILLFPDLEHLDLSANLIEEIDLEALKLPKLKSLHLAYNLIDHIPEGIGSLRALEELILLDNNVKKVPIEVCQLKLLRELNLTMNHIVDLPECLMQLPKITRVSIETDGESLNFDISRLKYLQGLNLKCKLDY